MPKAKKFMTQPMQSFFYTDAGKSLAAIAWRSKQKNEPLELHEPPCGAVEVIDNRIMRIVYEKAGNDDHALSLGIVECARGMAGEDVHFSH